MFSKVGDSVNQNITLVITLLLKESFSLNDDLVKDEFRDVVV